MAIPEKEPAASDFALVQSGPSFRIGQRLGLVRPSVSSRLAKVTLLLCVTWAPLFLLSLIGGRLLGSSVAKPLLHDLEANARFLFVLPVLELAGGMVGISLAIQVRHLLEMGLVPKHQIENFLAIQKETTHLRESMIPEAMICVAAYSLPLVTRVILGIGAGSSSWERLGSSLTLAGWWNTLVSMPILYFFLFRWLWIYALWAWFLYRVSRLDLELTPTHPDRAGGLGFIAWGMASYSLVLMAVSATASAGFADEILHQGSSLNELKTHVVVFLVIVFLVLYAPLLSFSLRLARCRFQGLLDFGRLAWDHDRAFDEKWIKHRNQNVASLLGSSDIQSLADAATGYEHVNDMWLIPFDMKAFAVLMIAALLPMVPLLGTSESIQEIFLKLGELLL